MGILPKNNNTSSPNNRAGILKHDNTIYLGKVVSINEDPFDEYRIKVNIPGVDNKVLDGDLVFCDPFLPKFLSVIPKKGEHVKIIFFNTKSKLQNRQWIGPIISQLPKLNKDTETPLNTMDRSIVSPETSHKNIAGSKGVYPEPSDIGLQGRDNTDIIQRKREVVIRAGKFILGTPLKLNNINPGYFHVRMSDDGKTTTVNIVADNINLITHAGKMVSNPSSLGVKTYTSFLRKLVPNATRDDKIDLFSGKINDKVQEEISQNNPHSIVYGDKLVELIEMIQRYLTIHAHPMPGEQSNENSPGFSLLKDILKFDLTEGSFRSKNLKIH